MTRQMRSPRGWRRFFASWAILCALAMSGCGGVSNAPSPAEMQARIQDLRLEERNGQLTLQISADREVHPTVRRTTVPPGLDIRIPFAISRDKGSLNSRLRLPRGGINAIRVEDLEGQFGGSRILVQASSPVSYTTRKAGRTFYVVLSPGKPSPPGTGKPKKPVARGGGAPANGGRFIVPEVPTGSPEDAYTVGGKDVLKIVVFEEPELSKDELRVGNDGKITFPLIGRIRVAGMTTHQIEQEVTRQLAKDYLVNPQVTVEVKEFASKVVNVLGAVKTPGAIALKGSTTLLEILARAGGVSVTDAGRSIVVLRPREKKELGVEHITIDLESLIKGGDLSQNINLQDKDTVFIPQADQIFVFGEVKNPGPYKLRDRHVSVVEAISMAGGPTRLAAPNRTRIVRVENGRERVIQVNVEAITKGDKNRDIPLQAGDIVVIPETYF